MKAFLVLALSTVISSLAHGEIASLDNSSTLGHGLNLGNFLEAPKEGLWTGERTIQEGDFSMIKKAGFEFLRVPIRWSAHAGPAPEFTLDPAFFARIDWVVSEAEKNGLKAILDYHNDEDLMKNPDANADRLVALWSQIAEHYKDAPSSILFELLNEPHDKLDAAHWNALLARTLKVVRTSNPTRTVVIGPVFWNGFRALKDLVLPEDDGHLLVTIHYYEPMTFTHQGADWIGPEMAQSLGTKWLGTDSEKKSISDAFDQAAKWGTDHHRPLYVGEFGAFEKGEMDSRARWTAFVARTAEAHDMAWSYWEFCSSFGVFDPVSKQWREPLLNALLPPQNE